MITFLVCLALLVTAYFTYGRYLERLVGIDPAARTPCSRLYDGVDYVPLPRGRIVLITVKGYGVILLESQRGFRIAAVSRRVDRDIGRLEDNEGESELGYSSVSFVDCLALGFVQSHLFLQGWRNDAPNVFSQVSVLGIAQNQHQRVVRFAVIQSRFARDRAVNGYHGEPRPLAND